MRLLVHADGFRRVVGARVGVDGYIRFGEGGGGGGCKKDGWKEIEREREFNYLGCVAFWEDGAALLFAFGRG